LEIGVVEWWTEPDHPSGLFIQSPLLFDNLNLSPAPDFLANKYALPDLLLKDKREGRYLTGFPAFGWNAETGVTYGAAVQWFDNGQWSQRQRVFSLHAVPAAYRRGSNRRLERRDHWV
jgi:hypothetical protein